MQFKQSYSAVQGLVDLTGDATNAVGRQVNLCEAARRRYRQPEDISPLHQILI
jgi:hypothetical protein